MEDDRAPRPGMIDIVIVAGTLALVLLLVALGAWQGMRSPPL